MTNLSQLQTDYRQGRLAKPAYIQAMAEWHQVLFDYLPLLQDQEIAQIEITAQGVIFTVRGSGIRVLCPQLDQRVAPIESLNFGAYEPVEMAMVMRLLQPGFQVFDVGANVGWYALHMADRFPPPQIPVRVYAFEPLPATYAQLVTNLQLNACKQVSAYNFGFSNQSATLTFYRQPTTSVSASLANISGDPRSEVVHGQVQRLDDFVAAHSVKIDFLKCDVEGSELLVFQGGLATLQRERPIIFTEMLRKWSAQFHYHPNDIIQFLQRVGYQCFTVRGDRLFHFEQMDEQTPETNFFFLHIEQHQAQIQQLTE